MQVILYPNPDSSVSVIYPTGALSVEDTAKKDVPPGLPYLIIEDADLPTDPAYFNAWEGDFSSPDGHGGDVP
jgi:hypothetical protein